MNNLICVDDEYFNPYHILQVAEDDTDELIAQSFKKKVKKYHPDKAPFDKKENYTRKFKIIMDSYAFIRKKRGIVGSSRGKSDEVRGKSHQRSVDAVSPQRKPTDFGYGDTKRLVNVDEYDNTTHELQASIVKQLSGDFDRNEFNTLF